MRTARARDVTARTFSALKIRNYRCYFAGQSVSMIGTWMQSIAQSWLVFSLTRSGFAVGLVVAFQALPVLVFGPVGATLGDRFGKYRVLFWTQSLAGVQAAVLAGLELTGNLHLWELYLIAVSLGFIKLVLFTQLRQAAAHRAPVSVIRDISTPLRQRIVTSCS